MFYCDTGGMEEWEEHNKGGVSLLCRAVLQCWRLLWASQHSGVKLVWILICLFSKNKVYFLLLRLLLKYLEERSRLIFCFSYRKVCLTIKGSWTTSRVQLGTSKGR